ncbi:MAG TPA: cytidylate kinase family protein [Thermoplasmata archaeon]|nr:cytidylate kinase family protein [Thermoplasmata archaeon]
MIDRVVAIGGPPGSGKSTAGRLAAAALGLEYRSAGDVFRAEAKVRGLDLETFGRYAEAHPEVDRELDQTMQALARPGRLLDGRIQSALCRRGGRPVYAIVVTAEEEERARRVAQRDGQSLPDALRQIRERTDSERKRYRRIYDLDPEAEPADLTVDSTRVAAVDVADRIVRFLRTRPPGAVA